MLIEKLYQEDIRRDIRAAVVVSNQTDETIKAEIKEYVFTPELIEKLYKFLNLVLTRKNGNTGIWINGYYGSGKSHFIKYVHYCLSPIHGEAAMKRLIDALKDYDPMKPGRNADVTESNVRLLVKKMADLHCEDILFNVEDVTGDSGNEKLTRVFLDVLNQHRGYNATDIPLALLFEKVLDEKGVFDQFKQRIADDHGFDWSEQGAQVAQYQLGDVLSIGKALVPELDIVRLHSTLSNPDTYKIGVVDTLIPELKQYLKTKPADTRLVFLVDEISAYLGKNKDLLLNLQSIVEQLSGSGLNHQVWVACTAQQTLDEVVGRVDSTNVNDEFGKILGRFDASARISLESNDASFITQKRVLEKNATGERELSDLYRRDHDAIVHQFKLSHDLYKGYSSEEEFVLAYPFVPYQFRLISEVFNSFQQLSYVITEVKDNARSVLGITHYTATVAAEAKTEVGYFVPFDLFFNNMMRANLTHVGSTIISRALEISWVQADEFAKRVVRTLFMVSNLAQDVLLRFPPTVDNLTVLLMDRLDQNKLDLQTRIRTVLTKLIDESIIREENNRYFFFSEDEINVTNLIRNTYVTTQEKDRVFDDLFRKELKIDQKFRFEQTDFRIAYDVDESIFLRSGDVTVSIILLDAATSKAETRLLTSSPNTLYLCLNEWFMADESLTRDFNWYCQSLAYFKNNSDTATGVREQTHETFNLRGQQLRERIVSALKHHFPQTRFISQNRVVDASSINGTRPDERYRNALEKHLGSIYKYLPLAKDYAITASDLRAAALDTQSLGPDLPPAEQQVNDEIGSKGDTISVDELVKKFDKAPFGWKDTAVIHMLVNLNKRKKREFEYANQPRYGIREFVEKALSTAERTRCIVKSSEELPKQLIDDARSAYRKIFNKDLFEASDANKLVEELQLALDAYRKGIQQDEEKYYGRYPFGEGFHTLGKTLDEWIKIRDPRRLLTALVDQQTQTSQAVDSCKMLSEFGRTALTEYDAIRKFVTDNAPNVSYLGAVAQQTFDRLEQFFRNASPSPPDFRITRKEYDEIRQALTKRVAEQRQQVERAYAQVFDTLEAKMKELGVTEANVLANRDEHIRRIGKSNSLAELVLKESQANGFQHDQMEQLIRYVSTKKPDDGQPNGQPKVNEPEAYYISSKSTVLSNEAEVEAFLATLRTDWLTMIGQNKTVIIR